MKYHKGSANEAVRAAVKSATTMHKTYFVYPTYSGMNVDTTGPAFKGHTRYAEVLPTGEVINHVPNFGD